ncbi:ADP-ribosylation factor-like protein 9 [Ambystoma mexicanum]|uniref:ADP-ribosylation factor-like protein 9 n=1 Tax=Ambystoma mexicanum TaxID=8296 RepID=UPI0037E8D187
MSVWRGMGMGAAAAVALTGGVAYVAWSYLSTKRNEEALGDVHVPRGEQHLDEPHLQQQTEKPILEQHSIVALEHPPQVVLEPVSNERQSPGKQILVLGLDGSGKTSLLNSLATNRVKHCTTSTQGFNAVSINTEETQMEFLEIGGSESLRPYWTKYLPRASVLVFVVDSADHDRLPIAKRCLHELIQHDASLPLVVLANKQDLQGAYSIAEIHDALSLSEVGDERKMILIGTHVANDGDKIPSSIQDAKELIAQLVLDTK